MSNARVIRRPVARAVHKGPREEAPGGKKKWIIALVILLLLAVGAWAFIPAGRDPHLAKMEELRGQMENATPEQRRELWGKMREEGEQLSPEARAQMREERRKEWQAREQRHLNEFFALSTEDQIKEIDKDLDREKKRREEWEQRRAQGNGQQQFGRGGGGGGRGGGGRDSLERRKS